MSRYLPLTFALFLVSLAYGFAVELQSYEALGGGCGCGCFFVDDVLDALPSLFLLLLAGVGLASLVSRCGHLLGQQRAGLVAIVAGLTGYVLSASLAF